MHIGIDARLLFETGVGRYIRNLITQLEEIDNKNSYTIFLTQKGYQEFSLSNEKFKKVLLPVHWHTLQEQIQMPLTFNRESLDLVHVPYFTLPIFYKGKTIVTMHDLTILQHATGKATTLPIPFYLLRKAGYKYVLLKGLEKATSILAVSETTKKDLIKYFPSTSSKITVTYEGVDSSLLHKQKNKNPFSFPFFHVVGNAYPHKNLEILLLALQALSSEKKEMFLKKNAKIVFVGKNDFFYNSLKKRAHVLGVSQFLYFTEQVSDEYLSNLYKYSLGLLFPSLSEGFGLPALEALALDCMPIVSDIPVFRELMPENIIFLPPKDPQAWATVLISRLQLTKDPSFFSSVSSKEAFFSKYSWRKMAEQTVQKYEDCLSI